MEELDQDTAEWLEDLTQADARSSIAWQLDGDTNRYLVQLTNLGYTVVFKNAKEFHYVSPENETKWNIKIASGEAEIVWVRRIPPVKQFTLEDRIKSIISEKSNE